MTVLPTRGSEGTAPIALYGIATTTQSPAAAACRGMPARARGPSSATRSDSVRGPRELLSTTSKPASTASRPSAPPMFPLPMTPSVAMEGPRGLSEGVGDVVDDVLVADAPGSVVPAEREAVVPGLDRRDGALGAEGGGGPPALGLLGSDDVEGDELGFNAGLVAVDGDQVVVGGVVAPAQGRVRRHGVGYGRLDLLCSSEFPQRFPVVYSSGSVQADLGDCVSLEESGHSR